MAIDTTSPRTRRALLTAVVGTAAAATAASVARVTPVGAADGDNVKIGQLNQGSSITQITTPGTSAIIGKSITGAGLVGETDTDTGVFGAAYKPGGYAFGTFGRHKLWKICGVATIRKGRRSVTVKPGVPINGKSFVLLTPKTNIGSRGLWYTTNTRKNTITIRMSTARSAATQVAWLTLEWRGG